MTRRDLSGEIASLCFSILLGCLIVWGLSQTPFFSKAEAQESAELSDSAFSSTIPSGEIIYLNEEVILYGPDVIGGELRQAIIDTVRAVLARELKDLFRQPIPLSTSKGVMFPVDSLKSFSVEVRFTNGIPICPYCRVGTKRTACEGQSHKPISVVDLYVSGDTISYHINYDESGNRIPTYNLGHIGGLWECLKCGKHYTIEGNSIDGWRYGK